MTTALIFAALIFALLVIGGLFSLYSALVVNFARWLGGATPSEQNLALDRELAASRKVRRELEKTLQRTAID